MPDEMSLKKLLGSFIDSYRDETVYSKVHDDDKAAESTETLLNSTQKSPIRRSYYLITFGNILLFLASLTLFILPYTRSVTDSQCVKQLYTWCKSLPTRVASPHLMQNIAPAFEAIEYHEEDYTGVFRQSSEFRGKPTPEIDERWVKLWDYREFDVPESKWDLLNRTGDETIVRTAKGGGAALMWGMHQLHCLVRVHLRCLLFCGTPY